MKDTLLHLRFSSTNHHNKIAARTSTRNAFHQGVYPYTERRLAISRRVGPLHKRNARDKNPDLRGMKQQVNVATGRLST